MGSQTGLSNPDYDVIRREAGPVTEDAITRLFEQVSNLLSQQQVSAISPLVQSRCIVYATGVQSVPNGGSFLAFDAEDQDPLNQHNPADNTKISIRVNGLYSIQASARFAPFVGNAGLAIFVNGVVVRLMVQPCGGGFDDYQTFRTMGLRAGDVVQLGAFQDSGGAINVGGATRNIASELAVFGLP